MSEWFSSASSSFVSGGLLALVGAAASHYVTKNRIAKKESYKKVCVFEPIGESEENGEQVISNEFINPDFYTHFEECINSANREILVTGDGFGYLTPESEDGADQYHKVMKRALERGVHITRIQTAHNIHKKWVEKLRELKRDHKNKFELWMLENNDQIEIASFCTIDPGIKKCVAEFMLSVDHDLGGKSSKIAGTGIFIHGRNELAKTMKKNIRAMTTSPLAREIDSEEELLKYLD